MKIVVVSDTHGMHDHVRVPPGDVLIHCGDFSGDDHGIGNLAKFLIWLERHPHKHKIFIAGNHDWIFEKENDLAVTLTKEYGVTYLQQSSVEIDGVNFWGSPITPEFCGWAFNRKRGPEIKAYWDHIPANTDVLITHGPPKGILDYNAFDKFYCGCEELAVKVDEVKPKLHCFGHIHSRYGWSQKDGITFINASACDENYRPLNKPQIFDHDFTTKEMAAS